MVFSGHQKPLPRSEKKIPARRKCLGVLCIFIKKQQEQEIREKAKNDE